MGTDDKSATNRRAEEQGQGARGKATGDEAREAQGKGEQSTSD